MNTIKLHKYFVDNKHKTKDTIVVETFMRLTTQLIFPQVFAAFDLP